jgi:hypothetical protein
MPTAATECRCSLEAAGVIEHKIIVALTGRIAEQRSMRGGVPGWFRHRTRDEQIGFHEAGHAVIAAALGHFLYFAAIVPDKTPAVNGYVTAGYLSWGTTPEPNSVDEDISDRRQAARLCWILAEGKGWKPALERARAARTRAIALVDVYWTTIGELACLLQQRRCLTREDLAAFVAKHVHIVA